MLIRSWPGCGPSLVVDGQSRISVGAADRVEAFYRDAVMARELAEVEAVAQERAKRKAARDALWSAAVRDCA